MKFQNETSLQNWVKHFSFRTAITNCFYSSDSCWFDPNYLPNWTWIHWVFWFTWDVIQKESARFRPGETSKAKLTPRWGAWVTGEMVVVSTGIKKGGSEESLGEKIKISVLVMLSWPLDIHKKMSGRLAKIFIWTNRDRSGVKVDLGVNSIEQFWKLPYVWPMRSASTTARTAVFAPPWEANHSKHAGEVERRKDNGSNPFYVDTRSKVYGPAGTNFCRYVPIWQAWRV